MRLTSFSDFGLRTLLMLGSGEHDTWSSAELANKLNVSRDHLIKVVQRLAVGGYVQTTRGAGGGVKLNRRPAEIRLGEVLEWLDGNSPLTECFRDDGGQCLLAGFCALRSKLDRARKMFYTELNTWTLADCINPALEEFAALSLQSL